MTDNKNETLAMLSFICFSALVIALNNWLEGYPVIVPFFGYTEMSAVAKYHKECVKDVEDSMHSRPGYHGGKKDYYPLISLSCDAEIVWKFGVALLSVLTEIYYIFQDIYMILFFTEMGYVTLPLSCVVFLYYLFSQGLSIFAQKRDNT